MQNDSLTPDADHRIGRNIVRTFFDYYTYVGVLSKHPKDDAKPAKRPGVRKKARKRARIFKMKKSVYCKQRARRLRRKLTAIRDRAQTERGGGRSGWRLQRKYIDFSDIELPPTLEHKHTIKRKLLTGGRKKKFDCGTGPARKNALNALNAGLTILNIGE